MSLIRRKSTGSKANTSQSSSKNQNTEAINENKNLDKQETTTSTKSTKITGVPQTAARQTSIREQLKPKPKSQKSPPKKRMNSDRPTEAVNPTDPKQPELNPDHEELKRQIFAGIKLMLDPIKEDIKQIKLDQCSLKSDTDSCTGKQLKRQIIKNEEKQKKLETQISALEDQLLQKNVIFQGLKEDEYEDIQDTKTKVISAIANVSTGNTPEERKDTTKKVPIYSVEWLGKYISTSNRPVKVKFTNKTDIDNFFKNRKKLPDGVFIDKEYSRAAEKEQRLL